MRPLPCLGRLSDALTRLRQLIDNLPRAVAKSHVRIIFHDLFNSSLDARRMVNFERLQRPLTNASIRIIQQIHRKRG